MKKSIMTFAVTALAVAVTATTPAFADDFSYTMVTPDGSGKGFAEGYTADSADGLIAALYANEGGTLTVDVVYPDDTTIGWGMGGLFFGSDNWGNDPKIDFTHPEGTEEIQTFNVDDIIAKYEDAGSTGINACFYNGETSVTFTITAGTDAAATDDAATDDAAATTDDAAATTDDAALPQTGTAPIALYVTLGSVVVLAGAVLATKKKNA